MITISSPKQLFLQRRRCIKHNNTVIMINTIKKKNNSFNTEIDNNHKTMITIRIFFTSTEHVTLIIIKAIRTVKSK